MSGPKKLEWLAGGRVRLGPRAAPGGGRWVSPSGGSVRGGARLPGRPSGLSCRAGPSVVAPGLRRGGLRWLAVAGTCGLTVAWGDGGGLRAHAGGRVCSACGAPVCRASVVLGGWCVGVVGVSCWYVMG